MSVHGCSGAGLGWRGWASSGTGKTNTRLSVIIITRDEVHRIGRAFAALAFADEIVVLDSGSTDGTLDVARALDLARGNWILSINADELVTEALAGAIREAIRRTDSDSGLDSTVQVPVAWWIERRSSGCGRPIR